MSKKRKTKTEEKKIEVKYKSWVKLLLLSGGAIIIALFAVSFLVICSFQNSKTAQELVNCRSNYSTAYKQGTILPPGIYQCDETGCRKLVPK